MLSFHTRTEALNQITNELNNVAKEYVGVIANPELVTSIRKKLINYTYEKLNYIGTEVNLKLVLTKDKVIKDIQVVCGGKPMHDPMLKMLLANIAENKSKIKATLNKDIIDYDFNRKSKFRTDTRLINDDPLKSYDCHYSYGYEPSKDSNKCSTFPYVKSSREITKYPKVNKVLNYLASKSKKINEWVEYYDPQQIALRNIKQELQSISDDWEVLSGLRERNNY